MGHRFVHFLNPFGDEESWGTFRRPDASKLGDLLFRLGLVSSHLSKVWRRNSNFLWSPGSRWISRRWL